MIGRVIVADAHLVSEAIHLSLWERVRVRALPARAGIEDAPETRNVRQEKDVLHTL